MPLSWNFNERTLLEYRYTCLNFDSFPDYEIPTMTERNGNTELFQIQKELVIMKIFKNSLLNYKFFNNNGIKHRNTDSVAPEVTL